MDSETRRRIIEIVSASADELRGKCRFRSIRIFGSVARGDATTDSDVDILVDFEDDADLFDLTALGNVLEERLGRKVDVVSRNGIHPSLREVVEGEAISL